MHDTVLALMQEECAQKYETCTCTESQCYENEGTVKYAMVPVWILTTQFEGKPYTFMMNGQTGKFIGSLPIDKGKLQKYQMMAFAIVTIIVFALLYFVL